MTNTDPEATPDKTPETSAETQGQKIPEKAVPSLLKAAGLIAAVTLLSKFLGALRDWGIAYTYGTSSVTDAYFAAFQIPSFAIVLLGGLGGPFHTATVSVFSKLIPENEYPGEKAKQLAATFMTVTSLIFMVFSIICYCFATEILSLLLPGASPELIQSAAHQMQIMSPTLFIGGLVGIFYGLLNIYHIFFWPSFSPAAMSMVILAALWIMPYDPTGEILAWATLGGAIAQLLCQIPDVLKFRFSLKPTLKLNLPELKTLNELLFPAAVGTTIGQLITYVDMAFVAQLPVGGWSAVTLSNRLMQFPIGILQTALLIPLFPRFSRFVAEKNWDDLKQHFTMGVISLWFISIPILVIMLMHTESLIRLTFQHGSFTAENTKMVTLALIFQAFQMLPYFARDSITRVFYAFNDSKTPMVIGLLAIGLKFVFNSLLVSQFGVGGITFSITLITLINMFLLGWLSKKHIGDLGFKTMMYPFAKLMAAGVVMYAIMILIQNAIQVVQLNWLGNIYLIEAVKVMLSCAGGVFIYTMTALAFQVDEAQYLFKRAQALINRKFPTD